MKISHLLFTTYCHVGYTTCMRCPFSFVRKIIGKAHTDFPTHALHPYFELLPSQTQFAEDSILYVGPVQNFRKLEPTNGRNKNWKNVWVASIYVRTFQNPDLKCCYNVQLFVSCNVSRNAISRNVLTVKKQVVLCVLH